MKQPTINELRDYAITHGMDRAVTLFTYPNGKIGYVSWGLSKKYCRQTKEIADKLYELFYKELTK